MSDSEITVHILNEWEKIRNSSTLLRLGEEYNQLRTKKNINKKEIFSTCFKIKTKAKNPWLIFLNKAPADNNYKGTESINMLSATYYYSANGLKVYKISQTGGLHVYNDHFFRSYNDVMDLNLTNPIEIVEHFFNFNGYSHLQVSMKNGKETALGICNSGFLLGELQYNRHWLVYNTFISWNDAREEHLELKKQLLDSLQKTIEAELYKPNFDRAHYQFLCDIMKSIKKD